MCKNIRKHFYINILVYEKLYSILEIHILHTIQCTFTILDILHSPNYTAIYNSSGTVSACGLCRGGSSWGGVAVGY